MIQKIMYWLGFAPWKQVYELQKSLDKMQELCERKMNACKSLEKQKAVQFAHIQLLDKEVNSLREQVDFWSEGKG